jgi:hypothetical protein
MSSNNSNTDAQRRNTKGTHPCPHTMDLVNKVAALLPKTEPKSGSGSSSSSTSQSSASASSTHPALVRGLRPF